MEPLTLEEHQQRGAAMAPTAMQANVDASRPLVGYEGHAKLARANDSERAHARSRATKDISARLSAEAARAARKPRAPPSSITAAPQQPRAQPKEPGLAQAMGGSLVRVAGDLSRWDTLRGSTAAKLHHVFCAEGRWLSVAAALAVIAALAALIAVFRATATE